MEAIFEAAPTYPEGNYDFFFRFELPTIHTLFPFSDVFDCATEPDFLYHLAGARTTLMEALKNGIKNAPSILEAGEAYLNMLSNFVSFSLILSR
jgi:hypothetical protein